MPRRRDLFTRRPILIGVVHLLPLPGAPGAVKATPAKRAKWLERARSDAATLAEAGFHAVLVENFGDVPFFKETVPPETVAAMAVAARAVRETVPASVAVGVNVLRNAARAALGIAAATELDFVRVNVLVGSAATDQGLVEGRAAEVVRARDALCPDVRLLADVHVKHAVPLGPRPIEADALDLVERGGADAVIVTGTRTGGTADPDEVARVRAAIGAHPLLVGSGVTAATLPAVLAQADGAIVGTAVERGGRAGRPVDARRARAFVEAARGAG